MVRMQLKKILCLIQVNILPRNSTDFPEKFTNFDCRLSFRRKWISSLPNSYALSRRNGNWNLIVLLSIKAIKCKCVVPTKTMLFFLLVQLYPYFRQKKTTIKSQWHCQAQLDVDTITHVWANRKNGESAKIVLPKAASPSLFPTHPKRLM